MYLYELSSYHYMGLLGLFTGTLHWADDVSAVSELGDVIDGASAVTAFENEPCSVKGISKLGGVTKDANGVTVSVLAFMFGGKSAVSELAIAAS